ncbi:condensin complex subunit 2 [Olea europaea subsp. europaea]|uniref:Condensin complex subunit 2 n=1 Tax=Olea europaea subsp. europaea TaxID=158383 RepID=A0A8S0QT45_OLEEU|nr:condensin complex subunit 2 [Olea europaea subsp. europaea]
MAETLSPNPKQRGPFSPSSPFFLGSNDDKLERAQARAARAAAVRRKPAAPTTVTSPKADPLLGKEQILELFQNCIKLASENKINQKNTWELNLIDHLYEIIRVDEENDVETNFQKASCTLEAGVKIYSMRVDSVHSEAYKVLGGINRVGQEDEQDSFVENANIENVQEEGHSKKERERKLSPLSTLESSFEALNVKKFDVAFVVDPLYHQTSAQFDEGGAKGLLLNNLGVYGNCRVLFDSLEVPARCSSFEAQGDGAEAIDISFARECIEQMILDMPKKHEISPSLMAIFDIFDEDKQKPSESFSSSQSCSAQVFQTADSNHEEENDAFESFGTWGFDHDGQASVVDEGSYDQDQILPSQPEGIKHFNFDDLDEDNSFEKVDGYLFSSLGFASKKNAWAGPDHWKYQKGKDSDDPAKDNGLPKPKKSKNRKAESDIELSNALDTDVSDIFAPPKNPKSLILPTNRAPCKTKLPEDCHYQPENLVKLFLLPHVTCIGRRGRKTTDEASPQRDDYGEMPSWDDEGGFGGTFDDGISYSDADESSTLVSQPRQVSKIEVQFDKTSKQVDVHLLKETLWGHMQKFNETSIQEETVSFRQVLANFPDECKEAAAASVNDISPHLCFICLLHLANEHGLSIHGCPSLDDLTIQLK